MPFPEFYGNQVHEQCHRYANWFPGAKVAVGDIGQLDGKLFVRTSKLNKSAFSFEVIDDDHSIDFKFKTDGVTETEAGVQADAGGGAVGSAGLQVHFAKEGGIYFSLSNCREHFVDDLNELGEQVLAALRNQQWKLDDVIVVRTVTAGSATILQAESGGVSFSINGKAPLQAGVITAGGSAEVKNTHGFGVSIIAEQEITPLLGLARVKYTLFDSFLGHDPIFKPSIALHTTNTRKLGSKAARLNVRYIPPQQPAGTHTVKFRLARKGNYIDVRPFLDFTTSACLPASASPALPIEPIAPAYVSTGHMKDVIGQFDSINLDDPGDTDDFIHLSVDLPKCGKGVGLDPLVSFASAAIKAPPASARVVADLVFEEVV